MALRYQLPFSNPDVADGFGSMLPPRTNPHRGLDFAQPVGTPIPAVAAGVIADKGYSPALGYYTVVGHPDGMYTGYCHSNQASPLAIGAAVSRGGTINAVGNLGFTTGPHLHLTLSTTVQGVHTGTVQDPLTYINARLNGDDPTPVDKGAFMALSDSDQYELITKTRSIFDALFLTTPTSRGSSAGVLQVIGNLEKKAQSQHDAIFSTTPVTLADGAIAPGGVLKTLSVINGK